MELSLEGSVKIGWDNTPADTKASILAEDSKSVIADRLGRLIKIHFIGDGYFEGSRTEKAREYAQALFSLELRSICSVDEYIYWFRKYFFQSSSGSSSSNVLCKNLQSMEGNVNPSIQSTGRTDGFSSKENVFPQRQVEGLVLSSIHPEKHERLRGTIKQTLICCDNNDFPTIIGESSEPRKRKKQSNDSYPRNSRITPFRRKSWWSKSKVRIYKSGQRSGPTRVSLQGSIRSKGRTPMTRTFRRAHTRANESFKDCNC
ncbi:UNVERIFIED_CONTAM: hypothetical protein Sangu_2421800 [Sesamum angustifolium]|uniref:Uncharacterized protein n=1 Tax=Sesamum angustifolium TaxID=2727405 RepID=A0AAW2KYK1_9LAMI